MTTENARLVIDFEREKSELLEIRDLDRAAHFTNDVNAALSFFGDTYTYVRDGQIHQQTRDDLKQIYDNYFRDATFHEWDDLEPPIIQISNDGSMAWMIRRFRVRYTRLSEGQTVEETYVYAGMTTYERRNEKWVRTANVSTFA